MLVADVKQPAMVCVRSLDNPIDPLQVDGVPAPDAGGKATRVGNQARNQQRTSGYRASRIDLLVK